MKSINRKHKSLFGDSKIGAKTTKSTNWFNRMYAILIFNRIKRKINLQTEKIILIL